MFSCCMVTLSRSASALLYDLLIQKFLKRAGSIKSAVSELESLRLSSFENCRVCKDQRTAE